MLAIGSLNAQSFQIKELAKLVGNWEGNLTYMDYSSGKPFTMLANVKIGLTADKKGYVMKYEYPKEPHANSVDTTFAASGLFGKDRIVSFKKETNGDFQFVTEIAGADGNDDKKAILRHIYLVKLNTFSITKEVKFEGADQWIKRNEYQLKRVVN